MEIISCEDTETHYQLSVNVSPGLLQYLSKNDVDTFNFHRIMDDYYYQVGRSGMFLLRSGNMLMNIPKNKLSETISDFERITFICNEYSRLMNPGNVVKPVTDNASRIIANKSRTEFRITPVLYDFIKKHDPRFATTGSKFVGGSEFLLEWAPVGSNVNKSVSRTEATPELMSLTAVCKDFEPGGDPDQKILNRLRIMAEMYAKSLEFETMN